MRRDRWLRRRGRPHLGVVLLIVLVAIIVIGVALVEVARATSRSEIAMLRAQAGLQRRWGMISCQRAVLPGAIGAMMRSDAVARESAAVTALNRPRLPSALADRLVLGGQSFSLILADEDAKVDLNVVYDLGGASACQRVLGDSLTMTDSRSVSLRPRRRSAAKQTAFDVGQQASRLNGSERPDDDEGGWDDRPPPAFDTWGEVFDFNRITEFTGDVRHVAVMSREVTLWGSGRLNVWRASDDAIVAVCREVVQDGLARRIQQRIRGTSLLQVDLVLRQTVTNDQDRRQLVSLLADESQVSSLWIEASGGMARTQQMAIRRPGNAGLLRTSVFEFP